MGNPKAARLVAFFSLSLFGWCQSVCPDGCLCSFQQQPRAVMCVGRGLETIPGNISDVVQHLDLSNNRLAEVTDDIARLADLELLSLSRNQLHSLPSSMGALKNLRRLDLTGNRIVHVADIAVISELPSLTILYLSHNPLTGIEGLASDVLQAMDASHCGIREFGNQSLDKLPALLTLSLAGNPLRVIYRPTSEKLRWLDVSSCLLNYLTPDTFGGLPALEELRLADNPKLVYSTRYSALRHLNLKRLDASRCNLDRPGLHNLPLLVHAKLSWNSIRFLPDRIFARNRQLTHLYLNSNGLDRLNASTFEGLVKLQALDLSVNALRDVPGTAFQENIDLRLLNLSYNTLHRLPNLTSAVVTLDVSSNLIDRLDKGSLANMPRIRKLDLNDNRLRSLPDGLASASLTDLCLKRNMLVEVSNDSFVGLPGLQRVDVSGNRLTEAMSPDVFRNNPSLAEMHLEDNPWRCECALLREIFDYLTDPPAKADASNLICQSPSNVSGYSWESACFNEWRGPATIRRDRTWGFVLISLLTLLILCGSVASIRHTMRMRRQAAEQRRELELAQGRERLRLLQRRNQRLQEELRERTPEPRIHPLELTGPPSYEEAVHMPRLAHSLDALDEISAEHASIRALGSVDNLRAKRRRSRRPRKRVRSDEDLLRRQERREVRRRRERDDSLGDRCQREQSNGASRRDSRVSVTRRSGRRSVAEEPGESSSSRGRPRPQTPTARKKKRRRSIGDGHSTDDEDSDERAADSTRSLRVRELRREPRSGYRERSTDLDV